jgi:phosphinothricin acetyltransferase
MHAAPSRAIFVDAMRPEDWPQVRDIYAEGVATGHATFETQIPSQETWHSGHLNTCRSVARSGDDILGWAALSPVSGRCVYAGVAEVSIYVRVSARGQGIGTALMRRLIGTSEAEGIWTLQAGIFPENTASLSLHRNFGFRTVGFRERIGAMNGRWRDVMLLERRSRVVGV